MNKENIQWMIAAANRLDDIYEKGSCFFDYNNIIYHEFDALYTKLKELMNISDECFDRIISGDTLEEICQAFNITE